MLAWLHIYSHTKKILASNVGGIDYIQEHSIMEFEPNSTQGNSLCANITILSDYAVEDTENFTVYLTSNSTDVIIPIYAQSVQVQILEGTFQCKPAFEINTLIVCLYYKY